MAQEFNSFSFSIPDVYKEGFYEVSGIAKVSRLGLTLEFEARHFGKPKPGVREVQIPLAEIESVSLKEGWLRTELVVKARSLSALNAVPGSVRGQLTLRLPRKERDVAKQAFSLLRLNLAEAELKRLDEESGGLAGGLLGR